MGYPYHRQHLTWNSKGERGLLDWNSDEGIHGGKGVMQSGIPKAWDWEVSALNFHGRVWQIAYLLTFPVCKSS